MFFRQIFDEQLAQYAYLIGCQRTGEALIIDPERDVERYVEIAADEDLTIVAATETHIHADFLSGCRQMAESHGVRIYLSDEGDADWKYQWPELGDYDVTLIRDGDIFMIGNIQVKVLHTPGHTPEHVSLLITDLGGGATDPVGIASGDFVFVGDLGRPDLLETAAGVQGAREPSARRLYASSRRFLELPDYIQVWPGHGAGSACGKALGAIPQSTVGYERRFNSALTSESESAFVESILEGQPEPPGYFARMKKLNKEGVPLLGEIPQPPHLSPEALVAATREDGRILADTRSSREDFFEDHVAGSLFAPMGTDFAMVVGSYAKPEDEIYLVVEEDEVDIAVLTLLRIGYDRVGGYITPDEVAQVPQDHRRTTPMVAFESFDVPEDGSSVTVLDVRTPDEYDEGHLPGALNIAHTRLPGRLGDVPRDQPVFAYCRTGRRASFATALLERAGYEATVVDGSVDSWPGRREKAAATAT